MAQSPTLSFEFFPPKSEKAAFDLDQAASELAALNPAFMTVTYGAGGSTRDGTFETATRLAQLTKVPFAAHLTFCGTPKDTLHDYAHKLWNAGIKHLVVLRGDLPAGKSMADFTGAEFYHYTSDFAEGLLRLHPFDVSVGAYPEKHPDAPSLALDIEALRKKCAAGASRAITQFFFDNGVYYRFLDETAKVGITTPIVPGLLPIGDIQKVLKFAATCHAHVPQSIQDRFKGLDHDPERARAVAVDILSAQLRDLIAHGVPHLHFYTLNRSDLTLAACKAAGLAV